MRGVQVLPTADVPTPLRLHLRRLLDEAFGGEFSDHDWNHCLGGWHLLLAAGGLPLSHAAVVPRTLQIGGLRWRSGYVEGVATLPRSQGQGLGSAVMRRVGQLVRAEFDIGALSTSVHSFYERHGWERWQGPTYVRRGSRLVRTEDDDAGVMVLRFGPSARVSLTESIACEERPGDDW